jgi:hypothetical protein
MAQFSAYGRQSNHINDRTIAVRNIIRDVDAQRLRRIGGYNGANPTLGCSGSTFWRRWFLYGASLPLLWRGPRHDIGDRYYSPSVEGLTPLVARYDRPPQLAASFISNQARNVAIGTSRQIGLMLRTVAFAGIVDIGRHGR